MHSRYHSNPIKISIEIKQLITEWKWLTNLEILVNREDELIDLLELCNRNPSILYINFKCVFFISEDLQEFIDSNKYFSKTYNIHY